MSSRADGAVAGVAAGAVTLGVAEVGAALLGRTFGSEGTPSPLLAVGGAFVDRTPAWLKDLAVTVFGTADKVALFVGMGLTLVIACAVLGEVALRRRTVGLLLFALVGAVGLSAVLSRPGAGTVDAVPTLLGVLAGLGVLARLVASATHPRSGMPSGATVPTRRSVLAWSGGLAVLGVVGIVAGRALARAGEVVEAAREAFRVPTVRRPVTVPAGAEQGVPGQATYLSPTDDFYRIDTALSVPQVDPATWRLRVHGMVDREVEIDLEELLDQPMVEALVTLCCVSNTVGGSLVGNAVWTGWPVRELLERAGVQDGADMVLSTSTDGFTAGTPLEVLTDDRNALLAVAMNGEPLPDRHGFPVRMVVPGLYGYVSATKWVVDLKVTTFAADEGYWTPRGWGERGPVKTASRIDVPRAGADLAAGPTVIAGVAWAQHRGIDKVEVQVDDGPWEEAELALEPSVDSWRQWKLPWDPAQGEHTITVRATDGEGQTQTSEVVGVIPDGATGWHRVEVSVGA